MINTKKNTHTHIVLLFDEMLQSQRQRTNNDLQSTIYRKQNIEQREPHYKPAIFTTRPNLQERYHVNKLWLWDEPDVRKIGMSMCIPQLAQQ